jgi:hypothetical protein
VFINSLVRHWRDPDDWQLCADDCVENRVVERKADIHRLNGEQHGNSTSVGCSKGRSQRMSPILKFLQKLGKRDDHNLTYSEWQMFPMLDAPRGQLGRSNEPLADSRKVEASMNVVLPTKHEYNAR